MENSNATNLTNVEKFLGTSKLILDQMVQSQKLNRFPEPESLYDQRERSFEYSQTENTVMMAPYFLSLDIIKKLLGETANRTALDLCCGPGIFTKLLAKILNFSKVTGVDLASPMIQFARESALKSVMSQSVDFQNQNILELDPNKLGRFDLVSFMYAAHHFDKPSDVSAILAKMEALVNENGVVFILDVVRPKTEVMAQKYVDLYGVSYLEKNLKFFHEDFRNSLLAGWTVEEFREFIPSTTQRAWWQFTPLGYPALQIVVGVPQNRQNPFKTKIGLHAETVKAHLDPKVFFDFLLLSKLVQFGKKTRIG